MARLADDLIRAQMNGEHIADAELLAVSYGLSYFDITAGDGSKSWHTCTHEQLPAAWDALLTLKRRLSALESANVKPLDVDELDAICAADERLMADDARRRFEDGHGYGR